MERRSQVTSLESWKPPTKKFSVVTKRKRTNQRLLKATSVHSLNKASVAPVVPCRPVFFRSPPPPMGRRSVSLQDVSPGRLLDGRKMFSAQNMHQDGETLLTLDREIRLSPKTRSYVMKAYCRFLSAAWRSCRETVAQKNEALASQLSQIKNLQMQNSSMKSLLESDVEMISDYCKEIRTLGQKVQELETKNAHYAANYEDIVLLIKQVEHHAGYSETFLGKTLEDIRRIETNLEYTQRNSDELKNTLFKMATGNKKLTEEKEALTKNLETTRSKIVYLEECLKGKMIKIIELNSNLDAKCKDQWISGILKTVNGVLKVPLTLVKLIYDTSLYD